MNKNLLDTISFSDEAWFHLSGYMNSQKMPENPHYFRETPLHAVSRRRRRLYGPIFVKKPIIAAQYQNMLQGFIDQFNPEKLLNGSFQHDGTT